jgi:hypothetical protein
MMFLQRLGRCVQSNQILTTSTKQNLGQAEVVPLISKLGHRLNESEICFEPVE